MVKHNNVLPNIHLRKHWHGLVKTFFNQPAHKRQRLLRRQAKAASVFPRPLQRLRPLVHGQTRKYAAKIRYGRGFTLLELKRAGLSAKFARTVGIAVDPRRTNSNEETLQQNVQRLENYKSKLILFPRKKTPKKGEINDSSADKLKSAEAEKQVRAKHILEKPAPKLREKFVKITDDMKKVQAYK